MKLRSSWINFYYLICSISENNKKYVFDIPKCTLNLFFPLEVEFVLVLEKLNQ